MNKFRVVALFSFALLHSPLSAQLSPSVSAIPVRNVAIEGRTMDILVRLAEEYKVVIGVYGTLVGSDSTSISISVEQGTLKDVLDDIVHQDHRFEWHQDESGSVHVSVRGSHLPVIDVVVSSFDNENLGRVDAIQLLTGIPEVRSWLDLHHCSMDEIIAGPPLKDWAHFSVHIKDKPLSSVFDEIASKSHTYLWAAIQYIREPCTIDANFASRAR